MPGAGQLPQQQLEAIFKQAITIIEEMGGDVLWERSFVCEHKFYCVYQAPNRGMLMLHAKMSGFSANRIEELRTVIDPTSMATNPAST